MEDLFGPQAKAVVGFENCRKSHPRFQFDFDIPHWLRNYDIVHIKQGDDDPVLAKAVHKRYHMVLDNVQDRASIPKAISVGETFAIVRPAPADETTIVAVAAITFAVIGSKVFVLFLGADESYRNAGFGTQLLMLTGLCLKHRGFERISMHLLANENDNYTAWKFYKTRGFEAAASDTEDEGTDSEAPSEPDTEVIQEFIDHPILSSFVLNEANTLKLMCLDNFDSFQFGSPSAAKTHPCFLLDPQRPKHVEEVDDPMVYAQFPGKLSLKEMNHCGKDMFLLQQPGTFQVHDDGPIGILKGVPKSQFVVIVYCLDPERS